MFKRFVSFLLLITLSSQLAFALPTSNAKPAWAFPGAQFDYDFVNNRFIGATPWYGTGLDTNRTAASLANEANSGANASSFFAPNSSGILQTFPQYALRRTDLGVFIEGNYTNSALWSRDISQSGTWTATNASVTQGIVGATVLSGGSGYNVNDTITLAGGTFTTAAIVKVLTVNSGAITSIQITNQGAYTGTPNPATQGSTSGTGTGATFTISTAGATGSNFSTKQVRATAANGTILQTVQINAGASSAVPAAGGTGYATNNTITLNDGCSTHTVLTVSAQTAGVVTAVTVTTAGNCATTPANPVSQLSTSGSGTGATFTVTYPTRTYSAYVRRVGGTGVINMTGDNVNFTDISSQINQNGYTMVYVNPPAGTTSFQIGFQIVSSGDIISVDMNQLENHQLPTTPMLTTTTTLLRGSEEAFYMGDLNTPPNNASQALIRRYGAGQFPFTIVAWYAGDLTDSHLIYGLAVGLFFGGSPGGNPLSFGGATTTNNELNGRNLVNKVAIRQDGTGSAICLNGGPISYGASKVASTYTDPGHGGFGNIGAGTNPLNGRMLRQGFIPYGVPDSQLLQMCGG